MSLVYGYATEEIGFLVADTLITPGYDPHGRPGTVNGKHHGLKAQILNSDTAVAFAGDVEPALDLIENLHAVIDDLAPAVIPDWLFGEYTTRKRARPTQPFDCDFLVLQLSVNGKRLTRVTDKELVPCVRTYIGDGNAYQALMKLRRPPDLPKMRIVILPDGTQRSELLTHSKGEVEFAEISDAMEALAASKRIDSVGAISSCVTRIVDARISGKLEYLQTHYAVVSPADGESKISLLASNSGRRGLAVYVFPLGVGYVLAVGDSERCRREQATTPAEFIEIVRKKYGLNLS